LSIIYCEIVNRKYTELSIRAQYFQHWECFALIKLR